MVSTQRSGRWAWNHAENRLYRRDVFKRRDNGKISHFGQSVEDKVPTGGGLTIA